MKYCTKCGKEIKEGAKFCDSCGEAITKDKKIETKPKDKKNNKKIIIIGTIILFVIIIGVIILSNIIYNSKKEEDYKKTEDYEKFEKQLEVAGENYIKLKGYELDKESSIIIKDIEKENLINNDLVNKCDGYVLIEKDEDEDGDYDYDAYIKCGNKYKTKGYNHTYSKKSYVSVEKSVKSMIYYVSREITNKKYIEYETSKNKIRTTDEQLGKYSCSHEDCKPIKVDEANYGDADYGYVMIYDNEYVIYDFKNEKIYKTGLTEELYPDKINFVSIWPLKKFYGIILNNKKYYSIDYKKVVSIKNGKLYSAGVEDGYLTIVKDDKSEELINIKTEKKSSAYMTDEAYDASHFAKDKIVAKFEANNLSVNNDVINIVIYRDSYMQVESGGGGALFESSRGKYSVDNNILTYKRMYSGRDTNDGGNWEIMKVYNNFGIPKETKFNIISGNNLSVSDYKIHETIFNETFTKTYSAPNFKF